MTHEASEISSPIGVIAAGGVMPFAVADSLLARGIQPVLFALKGASDPARVTRFRHPGNSLTPVLRKHAATYAERVRTEAPEYMQQVGAGGELVPASMVGENSRALKYRSTVDHPDCVAIEASRDRLELADKAGALEMGLDLADVWGTFTTKIC